MDPFRSAVELSKGVEERRRDALHHLVSGAVEHVGVAFHAVVSYGLVQDPAMQHEAKRWTTDRAKVAVFPVGPLTSLTTATTTTCSSIRRRCSCSIVAEPRQDAARGECSVEETGSTIR